MATETAIQWTKFPGYDEGWSWNPIKARHKETGKTGHFCVKIDAGCAACYASALNNWRGNGLEYLRKNADKVELYLDEKTLLFPLKTKKKLCFFTNSQTDLFGLDFGMTGDMLARIYAVMALTPQHLYLNLTKRSKARREWLTKPDTALRVFGAAQEIVRGTTWDRLMDENATWPLPNVFEGSSIACQKDMHQLDDLMQTPAAYRFVSYEPATEGVDLLPYLEPFQDFDPMLNSTSRLDWVIIGGESGPQARPFDLAWARQTIVQCREAKIPVFLKQLGSKPIMQTQQEENVPVSILDKKGGDMSIWPADLQGWREFPTLGGI